VRSRRAPHTFATRVVRGALLVASVTAFSLAAASGLIAQLAWESGESARVRGSADALAEGLWTEAQRENATLETAAADALQESGLAGDRLELWQGGRLVAAHPGGPTLGPVATAPEVARDWIVATRAIGSDAILVVAAPREHWLRALRVFLLSLAAAAPLCLILAWGVGRRVSAAATRPLADFRTRVQLARPENPFPVSVDGDQTAEVVDLDNAFRQLWERLIEALARERDFAANASHELRTPLTRLRLRLERAARFGGPEIAEDLADARREVDRMVRLVDSLLVLARDVSSGVPRETVNLADIVQQSARRLLPGPDDVRVEAPDEVMVRGDENLLLIAIENLLDNARKFRLGGAAVGVALAGTPERVRLVVESPGARIAPSDAERVFDRFFRGAEARSSTDGHGLGLPLCRHIARLHGGDARFVSLPGEDARFVMDLPPWKADPRLE
jgi:signal transduction histidine kinase